MPRFQPGDYVKAEFKDGVTGESERMWVQVDSCDDGAGVLFGRQDNEPLLGTGLQVGDGLAVSYEKVVGHKKSHVLYHGTSAPDFNRFAPGTAYLTPLSEAAQAYARSPSMGGGGKGKPRVLRVSAAPGKEKDIGPAMDWTFAEEDFVKVLGREAVAAREEGFRYVRFTHRPDGAPVIAWLYPHEDLEIAREEGLEGSSGLRKQ